MKSSLLSERFLDQQTIINIECLLWMSKLIQATQLNKYSDIYTGTRRGETYVKFIMHAYDGKDKILRILGSLNSEYPEFV